MLLQEGVGFESKAGLLCGEFACSLQACVGFLQVLCHPLTVQRHKSDKVN